MQFQADLMGIPVVRPTITETTALGAAYLAGLAIGFWKNQEEIAAKWKVDKRYEPKMKDDQVRDAPKVDDGAGSGTRMGARVNQLVRAFLPGR